jgi:hypothetical protein
MIKVLRVAAGVLLTLCCVVIGHSTVANAEVVGTIPNDVWERCRNGSGEVKGKAASSSEHDCVGTVNCLGAAGDACLNESTLCPGTGGALCDPLNSNSPCAGIQTLWNSPIGTECTPATTPTLNTLCVDCATGLALVCGIRQAFSHVGPGQTCQNPKCYYLVETGLGCRGKAIQNSKFPSGD